MIKLLPGLFAFFFLTTVVYAVASSIGFDKTEYLIPPDSIQRINVQLQDSSGVSSKAAETTDVYLTAGSPTAAVSTRVSKPYAFISPAVNLKLTVSSGSAQRGFMYKDSTLGSSILVATGSGRISKTILINGQLKITIGYPPPPPPPPPSPPAPVVVPKPKPVVASVPQITSKLLPTTAPQPPPKPDQVEIATVSAETSKLNIELLLKTSQPEVLASTDLEVEEEPSFFDELFFWLEQFIFDKIWL